MKTVLLLLTILFTFSANATFDREKFDRATTELVHIKISLEDLKEGSKSDLKTCFSLGKNSLEVKQATNNIYDEIFGDTSDRQSTTLEDNKSKFGNENLERILSISFKLGVLGFYLGELCNGENLDRAAAAKVLLNILRAEQALKSFLGPVSEKDILMISLLNNFTTEAERLWIQKPVGDSSELTADLPGF